MEPRSLDFGGVAAHSPIDNQIPAVQPVDATPMHGQNNGSAAMPATMPSPVTAADTDAIEEQWVANLEHLFRSNRDDPYALSAAVSQLRKEYLLKRYGKNLDNTRR